MKKNRPGGSRVMSTAQNATEDTYDDQWLPPLHVSFVLYDGPDVFFGRGSPLEESASTYYNYNDERYCFAAPRRAPTIFLMTPATGWANLQADLTAQNAPDSDYVTPTVKDMVCMAYPEKAVRSLPSQDLTIDEWLRDDNRKNDIMALKVGSEDADYEYAVVSQSIFERDRGFYTDTTGMPGVTCEDLRPEENTVQFRNKGGLAWCKGRKMIGVQIRSFYRGPDGKAVDFDPGTLHMVPVTRKGSQKTTTFYGAPSAFGKQTSVPIYRNETYIINFNQPFTFKSTKYTAELGFLALFHADEGDWADFELEGLAQEDCDVGTSLLYKEQVGAQVAPGLDFVKWDQDPPQAFKSVQELKPATQQIASFRKEQGKCIVRLTETQKRPAKADEATSLRYGMCYAEGAIKEGTKGCPMVYFNVSTTTTTLLTFCGSSSCGSPAPAPPSSTTIPAATTTTATTVPTSAPPAATEYAYNSGSYGDHYGSHDRHHYGREQHHGGRKMKWRKTPREDSTGYHQGQAQLVLEPDSALSAEHQSSVKNDMGHAGRNQEAETVHFLQVNHTGREEF